MLDSFAGTLVMLGGGIGAIGVLWLLFKVFSVSALWGVGNIVTLGLAGYVCAILYWNLLKSPVYCQIWGVIIMLIGAGLKLAAGTGG